MSITHLPPSMNLNPAGDSKTSVVKPASKSVLAEHALKPGQLSKEDLFVRMSLGAAGGMMTGAVVTIPIVASLDKLAPSFFSKAELDLAIGGSALGAMLPGFISAHTHLNQKQSALMGASVGGAFAGAASFLNGKPNFKYAMIAVTVGAFSGAVSGLVGNVVRTENEKSILQRQKQQHEQEQIKIVNQAKQQVEENSLKNKNTRSIYGESVSLENVQTWSAHNPVLSQSERLMPLADYNLDGKIAVEELHQAVQAKTVVLNGVKSFHIPGEVQATGLAKTDMSLQDKYYQLQLQKHKQQENQKTFNAAADVGAHVVTEGGSALLDMIIGP